MQKRQITLTHKPLAFRCHCHGRSFADPIRLFVHVEETIRAQRRRAKAMNPGG